MSYYRSVTFRRELLEAIKDLLPRLKLASGRPKYRSVADFVGEACERLLATERERLARQEVKP